MEECALVVIVLQTRSLHHWLTTEPVPCLVSAFHAVSLCGGVFVAVGAELCTNEPNSYCDRFTPTFGTKQEWKETEKLGILCMCLLPCDISPLNPPQINVCSACTGSRNVECNTTVLKQDGWQSTLHELLFILAMELATVDASHMLRTMVFLCNVLWQQWA
jgi:hypothetical protein